MQSYHYEGMSEFIKNNLDMSTKQLYTVCVLKFGYKSKFETFKGLCNRTKRKAKSRNTKVSVSLPNETKEEKLLRILTKEDIIKKYDLCNALDCSPKDVDAIIESLRERGCDIYFDEHNFALNKNMPKRMANFEKPLEEDDRICFGVVSDPHFGSKSCQLTALNYFAEEMKNRGVKHVLVPGDIFTGIKVYPGHEFDRYALTVEEQENSCLANLPTGFDWWMLGGNHDYSFISKCNGHNPLLYLQSVRKDIHYIGFDKAVVPLLPNVDCMLWHPSGGVPYSVSYRLQKGVEQLAFDELMSIVDGAKENASIRFILAGHLHIQMQAMFGPIFGAQCGTFEGTTNYLKRKGLVPAIGGWIIEATLNHKTGKLKDFDAKFYLYPEIEDDWKSYNHTIKIKDDRYPLFRKN